MENIQFSFDDFSELFPYHICFDGAGKITSHGLYLKHLAGIDTGLQIFEFFSCKRAHNDNPVFSVPDILPNETVILTLAGNPDIHLKGKFATLLNGPAKSVFIGSPNYSFHGENDTDLVGSLYEDNVTYKSFANFDLGLLSLEDTVNELKDYENVLRSPDGSSNIRKYAITVSDKEGQVVWCNKNFENLSGRSYKEIIGRRPREAIYGRRSVFIDKDYVDDKIKLGKQFYFENIGYSVLGREFWFGVVVKPIFNKQRQIVGRVHFMKDISKRKSMELANNESEKLMSLALEASRAGVWSYEMITREFVTAGQFHKIIGIQQKGNFFLCTFLRMMHRDDLRNLLCNILPKLTIASPGFDFESRILVNGAYRFFISRGLCVQWDSKGAPLKIVGTLRDRTSELAHTFEIRQQEKFYHNILDKLPLDIALFDHDHRYLYVNRNAIKNDEVRAWIIGKDDYEYARYKGLDSAFADERSALFRAIADTKKSHSILETKKVGNERKHHLRVLTPLLKEDGDIEFIVAYAIDITSQIENENKLKQQEERARNFLNITKDAVFLSDADGTIISYNPSFLKKIVFQDKPGGLDLFSLFSAKAGKQLKVSINELFTTGQQQKGVLNLGKRYLEYTLILQLGDERDKFVGRMSDITAELTKEKNLKTLLKIESDLNKRKTQFIHITSHELRTPLTVISTNSELLELMQTYPELSKKTNITTITRRIIKEVKVMAGILNQLMMVSKIERGGLELAPVNVDVSNYIYHEIAPSFLPFSDGRELVIHVSENVSEWELDPKIFTYVLVNIIGNAFKYSPGKASPQLCVSVTSTGLEFKITDFGIGIPAKEISSIFSNFYRASNTGVIQGTGIGLMVAEYGIKKHRGDVKIESEINVGSTFTITLPQNNLS